jgi:hypothetical protein
MPGHMILTSCKLKSFAIKKTCASMSFVNTISSWTWNFSLFAEYWHCTKLTYRCLPLERSYFLPLHSCLFCISIHHSFEVKKTVVPDTFTQILFSLRKTWKNSSPIWQIQYLSLLRWHAQQAVTQKFSNCDNKKLTFDGFVV